MELTLTPTQIQRFREDGVLIVDHLVEPELADRIAERYEELFRGVFETGVRPDEVNWEEGKSPPTSLVRSAMAGRPTVPSREWCCVRISEGPVPPWQDGLVRA